MRRLMLEIGYELRNVFWHETLDIPGDHHHGVLKSDRERRTANAGPSNSNVFEILAEGFSMTCATDECQNTILGRAADLGYER